ncbi:MAG: hypothetical protein HZB13_17935, partial [Acidobacteria bacterium]|nr:hypothetical protein [Acidobacteriota bacterium]
MKTLIFALTFALAAGAQTPTYGSLARSGAIIDHTSAAKPAPVQSGTPLPAACTVGELFYKTDATAGSNIYGCTAANTWTAQGGSYALPAASGSVLGGIKIGAGLTIDGNGVASASG